MYSKRTEHLSSQNLLASLQAMLIGYIAKSHLSVGIFCKWFYHDGFIIGDLGYEVLHVLTFSN